MSRATSPIPQEAPPGAKPLTALVLAVLAVQALCLTNGWSASVFARAPIGDAASYWDEAGRIASGRFGVPDSTEASPLYPYALGLLRALGLGLRGVAVVQAALLAATVALLARASGRRFGSAAGLVAGAALGLSLEPALAAGRLVPLTLQAFLVTVAWSAFSRPAPRQPVRSALLGGVCLGLAKLAFPPIGLAIPVMVVSLALSGRRVEAVASASGALLALLPHLTLILAGGEPFVADEPAYLPNLERARWLPALWLAPLSAWTLVVVGVATLALTYFGLVPRAPTRVDALDATLVVVPLVWLLVGARSPLELGAGLPLLAAWTGAGLVSLAATTCALRARLVLGAALAAGIALAFAPFGADARERRAAQFELAAGRALAVEGDLAGARVRLERARALGAEGAERAIEDLPFASLEDPVAALDALREAAHNRPEDTRTLRRLADGLHQAGMSSRDSALMEEASEHYERVLGLDTSDWHAWLGLANVQHALGRPRVAVTGYERGLALAPAEEALELHWGRASALAVLGEWNAAAAAWRAVLELDPKRPLVYVQLASALHAAGDPEGAVRAWRDGLREVPRHPRITLDLAWWLAASPDEKQREPEEALRLLDGLSGAAIDVEIERLDARAAAQAASGQFMEAIQTAEAALDALMREGRASWASRVRRRIDLYREGTAYALERSDG